jgi:FAD synthase
MNNRLQKDPYVTSGEVVKGFGRGSKELGIPTANFPEDVIENLPSDLDAGIYFGWASVNKGPIYKMVVSIGWNPFYKNEKKSVETHILHSFENDFYGDTMAIAIIGYIRPEASFSSLDELIKAINEDIAHANEKLESENLEKFKDLLR